MPKKGKKGKKEDPEVVAARLAQEQAEAEAQRRHDQEVADKAAWVQEQEDDFARREAELENANRGLKDHLERVATHVEMLQQEHMVRTSSAFWFSCICS